MQSVFISFGLYIIECFFPLKNIVSGFKYIYRYVLKSKLYICFGLFDYNSQKTIKIQKLKFCSRKIKERNLTPNMIAKV